MKFSDILNGLNVINNVMGDNNKAKAVESSIVTSIATDLNTTSSSSSVDPHVVQLTKLAIAAANVVSGSLNKGDASISLLQTELQNTHNLLSLFVQKQ